MADENKDPVKNATGESLKDLGWLVLGAAGVAVFLAPKLSSWLGISATVALILAGVALAYFGKGALKKAGQGAAVYGIATYAMSMIIPMLSSVNPFGEAGADEDDLFA